jgi:hypothetical protein
MIILLMHLLISPSGGMALALIAAIVLLVLLPRAAHTPSSTPTPTAPNDGSDDLDDPYAW